MGNHEQLLDYRRSVSEMYARARGAGESAAPPRERWERFRRERDGLFGEHPQSPLTERAGFRGLEYFPYDPALRYTLAVDHDVEPESFEVELRDDGPMLLQRFGRVRFTVEGREVGLSLFWVAGYGGGVILPFRDATSGGETYGGGRYLLDTIKHADLGEEEGRLVLDFNYAYNPSCAHDPRWHCPLPPPENHLPVAIPAGEKAPRETEG
ncbi:MAG: DUF1684 domain-containing protein [Rubrobacter sp.]|nr:DUF1684 domain-containing protein [Rubrobacter sp.]